MNGIYQEISELLSEEVMEWLTSHKFDRDYYTYEYNQKVYFTNNT